MEENKQFGQDNNPNPNQSSMPGSDTANQPQGFGSQPQTEEPKPQSQVDNGPQSIDQVINSQSTESSASPVQETPAWEPPKTDDNSDFKQDDEESSFGTIATIVIVIVLISVAIWFFNRDNSQGEVVGDTDGNDQTQQIEDGGGMVVPVDNTENVPAETTEQDAEKVKITAYYSKGGDDCSKVYPVEKEIEKKYDSDIINSVRGLLFGLTSEDVQAGYSTAIPAGTYLSRVDIEKGVAVVKLSEDLNKAAGSCAVTAARAQIEQTLLQFPYISSVMICAGDNCDQDTILQP